MVPPRRFVGLFTRRDAVRWSSSPLNFTDFVFNEGMTTAPPGLIPFLARAASILAVSSTDKALLIVRATLGFGDCPVVNAAPILRACIDANVTTGELLCFDARALSCSTRVWVISGCCWGILRIQIGRCAALKARVATGARSASLQMRRSSSIHVD